MMLIQNTGMMESGDLNPRLVDGAESADRAVGGLSGLHATWGEQRHCRNAYWNGS